MQRIKLELVKHFPFYTLIPIRITDLNYGGHVGNDTFLSLVHEGRLQFLQHYQYSELAFERTSLIMTNVVLEFKKELRYGDTVKMSIAATSFSSAGFDLHYLLEVAYDGRLITVAKCITGMLCYDYLTKKIVTLPALAVKKLSEI